VLSTGAVSKFDTLSLDQPMSQKLFGRTGDIVRIVVYLNQTNLK
jgi:hypothetical protein